MDFIQSSLTAGKLKANAPVRVIQVGLGPIGKRMVADVCSRQSLVLVGAVDINPAILGHDVGDVCNLGRQLGVKVSSPKQLKSLPGDVCIVTTVSKLQKLYPLLQACIRAGKHVVSTCEELSFPFASHPELSKKIDELARRYKVAVLGTGINPGFLMDTLPVLLSGLCKNIDTVRVERHQDSRIRRLPFQQKIGAGLELSEWTKKRDAGLIKHVGFSQSINLIAAALGWKLDRTDEAIEPVIAETDVSSPLLQVPAGRCSGVKQCAHGYIGNKPVITLELWAFNGLAAPHDTVIIEGTPCVRSSIKNGVHGDVSTSAIICNSVLSVVHAHPGLRTMTDIPVIHWTK